MSFYNLSDIRKRKAQLKAPYLEILKVPSLRVGLYELPAGSLDPQSPHQDDEVYYVLRGKAILRIGEQDHPVETGSIVYVGAKVKHRFHSIEEDLSVLVFFAKHQR